MNKLKPCPFCGGEADIEEIPGSPFTNEPYTWGVGCKTCNIGWYEEAKERAIDVWNRRPDMWIPVSERLPKEWVDVLVYSKFKKAGVNIYIDRLVEMPCDDECDFFTDWEYGLGVTHWMPLPLPPEGGAE